MKLKTLIIGMLISTTAFAQEITLDECLRLSRENYPLMADFENFNQQLELRLKTLNANYYPKIDLTAQYTWQNDVPGITAQIPGLDIPKAPKQQYRAYVDLQQVIYDGGSTKAAKQLESSQKEAEKLNVEVQLFEVRKRVIESFFLKLTIQEQLKQLKVRQEVLEQRLNEMKSAVNNGMLLQSEADQFEVELLKVQQDEDALLEGELAAIDILNELTGIELAVDDELSMPLQTIDQSRPEYQLFQAQQIQLADAEALKGRQRIPVIAGFGQFGYGNPGFNMLKDELVPFYMFGVRLKWNIWDWKSVSNQKQVLQLQAQNVSHQQETFTKNLSLAEKDIQSRIRQLDKVLEKDDQIISLRETITIAKLSQMNNGTITASDYIVEQNAESVAKLAKQIHLIERSKAEVQLSELGLN